MLLQFWWTIRLRQCHLMKEYSEAEGIKEHMWGFVDRIHLDRFDDIYLYAACTSTECCATNREQDYVELLLNGKIIPRIKSIISTPKSEIENGSTNT